jgi:hypothetical protein
VSDQRTNERVLPAFGVAKSLHHRHFKHVVGRGKAIIRFDVVDSFELTTWPTASAALLLRSWVDAAFSAGRLRTISEAVTQYLDKVI